jgi:hypothetical protein
VKPARQRAGGLETLTLLAVLEEKISLRAEAPTGRALIFDFSKAHLRQGKMQVCLFFDSGEWSWVSPWSNFFIYFLPHDTWVLFNRPVYLHHIKTVVSGPRSNLATLVLHISN